MRLIKPPGRIESGETWLDGVNIMALSDEQMRQLRLAKIAMVTQGAMNSLNPVIRIRRQIADGLRSHGLQISKHEEDERISTLLERVGLQREVADMFPHELSGGMKQRVCIAIAISLRPQVIIAGRIVEMGLVDDIFAQPQHPYTQLLMASLPSLEKKDDLQGAHGFPPSLLDRPAGCAFYPRCPHAMDRCMVEDPILKEVRPRQWAACYLFEKQQEVIVS
jgi:peptide/nickel transport system ATP-binding protein